MKKIVVLITHSLSEVDVLLPIFAAVRAKSDINVTCIFAVRAIYKQFLSSDFYNFCFTQLKISAEYKWLPNKFDRFPRRLLRNRATSRVFLALTTLCSGVNKRRFRALLSPHTIVLHEFTNQRLSTRVLYDAKERFNNPIFAYDHGHAVRLCQPYTVGKITETDQVTLLLFHEHNRETFRKKGFYRHELIGYPKFYEEWKKTLYFYKKRTSRTQKNTRVLHQTVVIFSRPVHPFYMDKEIYVQLLTSSIEIINRELKDASITVKPHPREDPSLIQEIITRNHFLNVNISHQHAGVLSIDALFTISFWGSTVLDALAIGVPAVEYYIEAERFREAEPDGSSYKALGIDSVSNPDDLANFIRRVINSDYNEPPFVTELNREANSVGIDIVLGISD